MNNLNKQDLLAIGIKLLALYVLVACISKYPVDMFLLIEQVIHFKKLSDIFLYSSFLLLLVLIASLVPFLMWKLSDRISKWAVKSNHTITIPSEVTYSLQSILFCSVGLFIFLTSFPQLIQWIIQYVFVVLHSTPIYTALHSPLPFEWISLVLRVGLGIVVMLKSKGLTKLIHKLRYAGLKNSDLEP